LRVARGNTGLATIDLILQAVHCEWAQVEATFRSSPSARKDSLGLPAPRRARRAVVDATTITLRMSPAEYAGLSKLASSAQASVSEVIGRCVDQHWPE
jgi:hypothetical protein